MVCHRLVRVFEREGSRYYQTRGDSLLGLDEPLRACTVLGRVIEIERGKVSLKRRLFLLFHPVLKYGRLNGILLAALIRIKRTILELSPADSRRS